MQNLNELQSLITQFEKNLAFYKDAKNSYNEHSCRTEYIDKLLYFFGWDVANSKGIAPQYREVIAENYSNQTDRPDYTLTLRGVSKLFVEAKKPSVDISRLEDSALQARKYGWNAKHKISVLTNFEYLIIYDATIVPQKGDSSSVARYRIYHFSEYVAKFEEMATFIARDTVYSDDYDAKLSEIFLITGFQKQQVDNLFLAQINQWRISLSNELYEKDIKYRSLEILNDVVQEFINQIVFLRICEDKNLPLYLRLQDTIEDFGSLQSKLEKLFREADRKYNAGLFSGTSIVFDLKSKTISEMVQGLYYPQNPYLFNIIEPNMLGKIYEIFLTEQLVFLDDGSIGLGKKKDCVNRSVVTTPTEIVKYMVEKTLSRVCEGKSLKEILSLRIADIACGSGIYLEEAFSYLQSYCVNWYLQNNKNYLIEVGNERYKLPLQDKKNILCSCIFGIDIDIHAVEVAKFSLLIKLIEDETAPSVCDLTPVLPNLSGNIFHGNALVGQEELDGVEVPQDQFVELAPFDWSEIRNAVGFDVIIGNPPYVQTKEMHSLLPSAEIAAYKNNYSSVHKQFDKYFIFLERAIQKVKDDGYVCFIVPNKFFKIDAGTKLRDLIATQKILVSLDDFGGAQLFEDKTIYSSIVLLQKRTQEKFNYSSILSVSSLWAGEEIDSASFESSTLSEDTWMLTTDLEFLSLLQQLKEKAVPLTDHAEIFNGIQTSAERPIPVYWFAGDSIRSESKTTYIIELEGKNYHIEKAILKPYFKPTKKAEKGLNSYSPITTDKYIIFPYDTSGKLFPIDIMQNKFPGAYAYLEAHYARLVPKCVSSSGKRDVPNATADTWYQYGRTQALTAFINTPKLIVGVLSQEPMYAFDDKDMLIASGGTAGYCAVKHKDGSPYALEYIQAWLANSYTERFIRIAGSDFEGGFIARGTFVLSRLPFVELDFTSKVQKQIYEDVVKAIREIYTINTKLVGISSKGASSVLVRQKNSLISDVETLIGRVYRFDF